MKLLQDKYSMNDTLHRTAVPGISVAKGGERELASAEVQESDTVRYVGPFDLRGGQAVFRFDGGHIYISLKDDHQPHFFYYHLKDHLGSNKVTKVGVGSSGKGQCQGCHGSHVSYTTYSDMCKSTNTSRSLLPLWDSRVLTSNNQVK